MHNIKFTTVIWSSVAHLKHTLDWDNTRNNHTLYSFQTCVSFNIRDRRFPDSYQLLSDSLDIKILKVYDNADQYTDFQWLWYQYTLTTEMTFVASKSRNRMGGLMMKSS